MLRRILTGAAAAAAVPLLVTSCGSGGTEGDPTEAADTAPPTTAPPAAAPDNAGSSEGQGPTADINALAAQVGDCFAEMPATDGSAIESVTLTNCDEAHMVEIVAGFEIDDTKAGPGSIMKTGEIGCRSRVPNAVDVDRTDPRTQIYYWAPDQVAWDNGDRTVLCGTGVVGEKTSGSIRIHGA